MRVTPIWDIIAVSVTLGVGRHSKKIIKIQKGTLRHGKKQKNKS